MEKELPNGWVETTIGDVADNVQYGYTASSQESKEGVRFLRITDIQDNRVNWETVPTCIIEPEQQTKFELLPKDIVFARTGATVGKSFLIDALPYTTVFASYLIRLSVYQNIQIKFVKYFFESRNYWMQISDSASGIGQPSVNASKLKEIKFPLPPLPEQQRIVAKLDTLFGHLDALKTRLDRIPQMLKDFRQKVLTQAVTGKLTEEWREGKELEEWKNVELKSVCTSITDGDHQAPPQIKEGIPFLVISNVSKGYFDFDSVSRFVPRSYFEALKDTRIPIKGDVLYTVTGSFGIPMLVDFDKEFCFQRHIAILKPDRTKIDSSFLQIVLSSTKILEQAREVATGTAQLTVPLSGVRNFTADIPELHEQQEIVRRVESLFAKADQIEASYQKLKAKIEQLPQALLAKAFRGELVAQLPTDGDARELLEQIKKAKASLEKGGKFKKLKAEDVVRMVAEEGVRYGKR